jgi:hypothetical protein
MNRRGSMAVKAPDYTIDDLIFFAGLLGGIVIVFAVLEPYGVGSLVKVICGVIVGAGLGWVCLQLFGRGKNP